MSEQSVTVTIPVASVTRANGVSTRPTPSKRFRWAAARILFLGCVGLCLFTGVATVPLAPLMSWWLFGDWRFWRHLKPGLGMFRHCYRVLGLMFRGEGVYMFSVPLTSPPFKAPVPDRVQLNPAWPHGRSCGPCRRCCQQGKCCPALDQQTGRCRGYNAFYWRYFNCGRFPSHQQEIDYYDCPKWVVTEATVSTAGESPAVYKPEPGYSVE